MGMSILGILSVPLLISYSTTIFFSKPHLYLGEFGGAVSPFGFFEHYMMHPCLALGTTPNEEKGDPRRISPEAFSDSIILPRLIIVTGVTP